MSHDSDESAGVPDDHLFVRPYVAPSVGPSRTTAPSWPQSGPLSFPGPAAPSSGIAAPAPAPARASRGVSRRGGGRRAVVGIVPAVALAVAGATVLLLFGTDEQPPPRSERPPELSVPALPARSPGADGEPRPDASRSGAPSAKATASASPTASGAATGQSPKPTPSAGASAAGPSGASGTLRMGDRGPEVRALQELLYGQGFTYVSITGVFDSQTKRGVSQLQRDRDIKGDPPGVYGPATRAALA